MPRERTSLLDKFRKFEQWVYTNMNAVIGIVSMVYIIIEAVAMGSSVTVDAEGQVIDGYQNLVLGVDLAKTLYLATVEFIFITLFSVITKNALSDGFQPKDLVPILASFAMMCVMTTIVLSVYIVDKGYITVGGADAKYLTWIEKPIIGRDYATFLVIVLSLFVAVIRSIFIDIETKEKIHTRHKEQKKQHDDKKKKSSSKGKPKEEEDEDKDDKKDHAENDLIKPEWRDAFNKKNLEALYQRLTAKDSPKPKLNTTKIHEMDDADVEKIFQFIIDEGEDDEGTIDREAQDIAARITAESWGVIATSDTIREHKDVALRYSK